MIGRIFTVLCVAALVGCGGNERTAAPASSIAAPDLQAGRTVAARYCKGCHDLEGEKSPPGIPNLAGQRERYLFTALNKYADGQRIHAALKEMSSGLDASDLHNVSAYYASLPPPSPQKVSIALPYDAGKRLATACGGCHGPDGNSARAGTPSLAGQQPVYFVNALHEYLRGERWAPTGHDALRNLSETDQENLAVYYASQMPTTRQAPPFGNARAGEPLSAVCGGCHGAWGVSNDTATPSLAAQDPDYLLAAIKAYRSARKHEVMQQQIARLSDGEIENIVAFYAMQKSKPAEDGQRLIQTLVIKCNRCHNAAPDSSVLAVPRINGQDKNYLIMALRAYRDDRRSSSVMHKMSMPFSNTIINSLAEVYASQPPTDGTAPHAAGPREK